ncbi:hypothetical protein B0O80DRAFT_470144 [Mortierella sp. GBAus27b]|nr:c-5 sterol desaturase [Mortierella sp. GBA43]KAI8346107.1 hypothetical protein B0O80DRAFT_470144 [Mortierella sp. GBAus27b]
MDVILDLADEYVFDTVYAALPAIRLPDLTAAIAAIPAVTDMSAALASSTAASHTLSAIYHAAWASDLTLNSLPTDNIFRQTLSLFVLTYLGALFMYFSFATPSYFIMFDQNHKKHPKYLKNQVRLEIAMSMKALPNIAVLTVPWLLGEVRGWSQLYTHIHTKDNLATMVFNPPTSVIQESVAAAVTTNAMNASAIAAAAAASAAAETAARAAKFGPLAPLVEPFLDGWGYVALSVVCFLLFTDMGIYWVHRWLHHPLLYKYVHKPHHKWVIPTPFSSHAFHPIDGYMQSVPYHIFVYLMPMQKYIYLVMFALVNFWSVLIHDGEYMLESSVVNSAAHHAVHHLYFNYNYGQYSTFWDRVGGSYRTPDASMYDPTLRMDKTVWKKQVKDIDTFDDNGKPTAASDESFTSNKASSDSKVKTL